MIITERKQNLFTVPENHFLAHCISVDCKMGAGIAVEFKSRFKEVAELKPYQSEVGECVLTGRVFNLFTKHRYFHKPTYETMTASLISLRKLCEQENVKYLSIPRIGCGLDRLSWNKVKEIIIDVFSDTDIEILVCSL